MVMRQSDSTFRVLTAACQPRLAEASEAMTSESFRGDAGLPATRCRSVGTRCRSGTWRARIRSRSPLTFRTLQSSPSSSLSLAKPPEQQPPDERAELPLATTLRQRNSDAARQPRLGGREADGALPGETAKTHSGSPDIPVYGNTNWSV